MGHLVQFVGWCGIALVAVLAVGGAIAGMLSLILYCAREIAKERLRVKEFPMLWRTRNDISDLGRWCSWYFPILGDVEQWLLDGTEGTQRTSIDGFRDELWRKYGKREPNSEAPAATNPS